MLARPAWPTLRSLVLRPSPASRSEADKVCGTEYEFSRREVADKSSVVLGYAMTEKQGGSDLRETQTTALFSHSADYHGATAHWYELTGHKWFCSVPQSDGFFTLAKVGGEVTCFFLPRTLPDGDFNPFFIQRLKDKGGGLREILSHAHLTRLDFAVGSAGLMRQWPSFSTARARQRLPTKRSRPRRQWVHRRKPNGEDLP